MFPLTRAGAVIYTTHDTDAGNIMPTVGNVYMGNVYV